MRFTEDEVKTINKRKIIGVGILLVIICLILVIYLVYAANENFRAFMDANILNKSIEQDNLKSITIPKNVRSIEYHFEGRKGLSKL